MNTGAAVASGSAQAAGVGADARRAPEVVVIGAGAFGGWTAFHLRRMGVSVTLVDAYGPGNSRATSGGETRSMTLWYLGAPGYGYGEVYSRWALRALELWKHWDEEWGETLPRPLFVPSGRLVLRPGGWRERMEEGRRLLDRYGIANEVLSRDEIAYRYPQIGLEGIEVGHYTPDAGLLRARQACEAVAAAFEREGGEMIIARVEPGQRSGGRLREIALTPGRSLAANTFVFACGPWLPKLFPDVMGKRLQTTRGHVYYFGTPPGDNRFTYPNLPNFDFTAVTGWPSLPHDGRGFRVRIGGGPPADPDTVERWIDPSYYEQPRSFLAERFPALAEEPVLETRVCVFDNSVDRNLIVDRHPELANVWIVGGGSGHGFKLGPAVGEYVTRRVTGQDASPEFAAALALKQETFP